jgi:hypothetical protein
MIVHCPNGHPVELPADHAGLETRCPTCLQTFRVPSTAGATTTAATTTTERQTERAPGVAPRQVHAAGDRWADRLNLDVLETLRPAAQLLLLVGILLALLSRGWDTIGDRNASAARARVDRAVNDWNDEWEDRLDRITEEEATIRAKDNLRAPDRERLDNLREERERVTEERATDRQKEVTRWNDLERNMRETRAENAVMKPWREGIFVIGTILFALGLLVAGYTTEGPARWFCLVLLVVVLLVYLGGGDLLPTSAASGTEA